MAFLKQDKTNFKYIFIVLILASLIGGGILWLAKTQEVPFTQLPEITKPEKPTQDETADWKTYRNEKAMVLIAATIAELLMGKGAEV